MKVHRGFESHPHRQLFKYFFSHITLKFILPQIFEKNPLLKKILGVFFLVSGILLHLIPLFPAGWIIVLGLELLGLRLLLQDKIKYWLKKS
jgi:hypothetical protein